MMRVVLLTFACLLCTGSSQELHKRSPQPSTPSKELASLLLTLKPANAFRPSGPVPHTTPRANVGQHRALAPKMLDIPRLTLPDIVTGTLKDFDLKSPNDMSDSEYNTYSGAAILGTLLFYVLPGAAVTDNDFGALLGDFAFSALIGGGLAIYASLRKDDLGTLANQLGSLLSFIGDIPRLPLPAVVSGLIKEQGLKSPNDLSDIEYNNYSYAAILGTLLFFILPGAAITDADLSAIFTDFIFSALTGGGIAAYLSLRKDGLGDAANTAGGLLLSVIDTVGNVISSDNTTSS
mmetsp:Transcript_166020/g.318824  ORF Transcript_166020/g.318824 Transcript_166020/m.318824 type:complete len:292 (-) Transcript_166020:261-1136(-)